jgi:hypothetical protein
VKSTVLVVVLLASACAAGAQQQLHWFKGNLHTHTLWSDGDDFPEMVVDWYKTRGYDFLALSDHNVLLEGEAWIKATNRAMATVTLPRYLRRFGSNWVETGEADGAAAVRLKTLGEFRGMFEQPGRFLLIPAEEITDRFSRWPIHLIASNLRELVPPQGGRSIREVLQRNIDAVIEQRERTGVPMIAHIAHPNFGWALTAEDMSQVKGGRFFEIYNGHAQVHNEGNATHAGTERMWDVINTARVAEHRDAPMWGLAVDDAHNYHRFSPSSHNAGRGWVQVRAAELTAERIIQSLERGDFYSSTGVRLKDMALRGNRIVIEIEGEPNVTYTTQFIGTRRPVDWRTTEVKDAKGHPLAVTPIPSKGVGAVLAEAKGLRPTFTFEGSELYVRAKIVSSKKKENGTSADETECAWTQPVLKPRER